MAKKNKIGTVSQVQELHDEIADVLLKQIREQVAESENSKDKDDNLTMCVHKDTIDNAIKLLRLNKTSAREEPTEEDEKQYSELQHIRKAQRNKLKAHR
ncbi:TPA: hypothetical protein NG558_000539 [Vibrio parahaemolyticus]|nr:hypothetical protein [Vibrio parahaemolyticus]HCG5280183.1 hypothetical protein [Vibrio parahaemolyticus]HCH6002655.1 hypothetical protein [Vibrio parahaemolyticus]